MARTGEGSDDLDVVMLCFLGVTPELLLKTGLEEMLTESPEACLQPDLEYKVCGSLLISLSGWNVFAL